MTAWIAEAVALVARGPLPELAEGALAQIGRI